MVALVVAVLGLSASHAARVPDIRATKHNFSNAQTGSSTRTGTVPSRTVYATSESEVCVFCHTPHAASQQASAPLWNRTLSGATYTMYSSSSLDAASLSNGLNPNPDGSSKLCLSCHDGTLAIGTVGVIRGQTNQKIDLNGTGTGGVMPGGSGATTGYTRQLGGTGTTKDLSNDHPISVTYNAALAAADGELRDPTVAPANSYIGANTSSGTRYKLPLERITFPVAGGGTATTNQVECATCHDPHIREQDSTKPDYGRDKFLRFSRLQVAQPTGGNFDQTNDIMCLACHDKGGASWAYSAHANNQVKDAGGAAYTYNSTAAGLREFPTSLPVWQAACLSCHDPHTVQGSRRLLREGTEDTNSPKQGGSPGIQETCYQCHSNDGTSPAGGAVLTGQGAGGNFVIPNIKSEFALTRHMPIKTTEQGSGTNTTEVHDIGFNSADTYVDCTVASNTKCGKDFVEKRASLGLGDNNKRHVECTDCHNPHRVVKFQAFYGNNGTLSGAPDKAGTHKHEDASGYTHNNIISGVLRGTYGVEPIYNTGSASFFLVPSSYHVKRGDPGANVATTATAADSVSYVTREYQICLKCHSDYGFSDNNVYPADTGTGRPKLPTGNSNLTTSGTNGLTQYTNVAREIQAPSGHRAQPTNGTTDSGAFKGTLGTAPNTYTVDYQASNHRSWHPVIDSTGRTGLIRGNNNDISSNWRAPFNNAVGSQTMYCSDCHGSDTTRTTAGQETAMPVNNTNTNENGNPWGPHGSGNDFILKGKWDKWTGTNGGTGSPRTSQQTTDICFKCHSYSIYAGGSGSRTGFYDNFNGRGDLHAYHWNKIGRMRCTWCHVSVPHGWKNKAFLANLNDVGDEAGKAQGTEICSSGNGWGGATGGGVTCAKNTGYVQEPYYNNAFLKVITFAKSGQWNRDYCGSARQKAANNGNGYGINWMKNEACQTPP